MPSAEPLTPVSPTLLRRKVSPAMRAATAHLLEEASHSLPSLVLQSLLHGAYRVSIKSIVVILLQITVCKKAKERMNQPLGRV